MLGDDLHRFADVHKGGHIFCTICKRTVDSGLSHPQVDLQLLSVSLNASQYAVIIHDHVKSGTGEIFGLGPCHCDHKPEAARVARVPGLLTPHELSGNRARTVAAPMAEPSQIGQVKARVVIFG